MTRWAGRKVKRLTVLTLATKGDTCHLCEGPGADSPDHDPPREQLIRAGVPNPDALEYLWPSHRLCNYRRNNRPITDSLRLELRVKRARDLERATADVSPRFAALLSFSPAGFPHRGVPPEAFDPSFPPLDSQEKPRYDP